MGFMITTQDNPFDPRQDFMDWYSWDVEKGYNTCAYLARITAVAEEYPEEVRNRHVEMAIDEIINNNGNLYRKLVIDDAA